jgi:hypothetical protein
MKYIILIIFFLVSTISFAQENENENDTLINLLIVSKATGMCGTIKQLASFQKVTKMPSGDEFLMRFLNTEMARLGKTLPQFLKECESAVTTYTNNINALGFEN